MKCTHLAQPTDTTTHRKQVKIPSRLGISKGVCSVTLLTLCFTHLGLNVFYLLLIILYNNFTRTTYRTHLLSSHYTAGAFLHFSFVVIMKTAIRLLTLFLSQSSLFGTCTRRGLSSLCLFCSSFTSSNEWVSFPRPEASTNTVLRNTSDGKIVQEREKDRSPLIGKSCRWPQGCSVLSVHHNLQYSTCNTSVSE